MPLSLDSIYKPLSDFFVNLFKADPQSPVFFRFAKIGSVISDEDFIDPNFPGQYSPALAKEKFSDIVNSVPIEDPDGQNIFFTQNNIDETYHDQLLGPSIPFIPEGTDDMSKDSIVNAFNNIKADAISIWNNIRLESSTGLMMDYKPALATPENWYDKTRNELWTPYSFHVEETATTVPDHDRSQLWKMRMDDAQLEKALPVLKTSVAVKPTELRNQVIKMKHSGMALGGTMHTMPGKSVLMHDHGTLPAATLVAPQRLANVKVIDHRAETIVSVSSDMSDPVIVRSPVRQNFHDAFWGLNVKNRVLVCQYIKANAPTQPVKTSSFSISFKYCVIGIDRPWLKTSFINNKTWFIPNTTKGQLTANDNSGANISVLPIGFVAIKELNIEANWSESDIEISRNATDFGPFDISSEIVNNKLSHQGIQIIGWLLQKMPGLPPNGPTR